MTQVMTLDLALEQGMNILVYGLQGSGKTLFASKAQDHSALQDVLFLNIEGGLTTVAGRGDIKSETIRTVDDLEKAFWRLHNRSEPSWRRVRTVVIDSITELQTINLEEIAKKQAGRRNNNLDDVQLQDYKQSTMQLKRLLRWFKNLPYNLVVTALVHKEYPKGVENADPVEIRPSLTGKLADSVMGYMDHVWYLYTKETKPVGGAEPKMEYWMLAQQRGIYRAKTRGVYFAQSLGGAVKDPSLPKLYDLFIEAETKREPVPYRA